MRWPNPFRRPAPKRPEPNSLRQFAADSDLPVVMVTLLLADAETTRRTLARHRNHRSYRPVFVTTGLDALPFRAAGAAFEMLPPPEMVRAHAGLGDWRLYLTERWRLLRSKWQPQILVVAGAEMPKYLLECGLDARPGAQVGEAP